MKIWHYIAIAVALLLFFRWRRSSSSSSSSGPIASSGTTVLDSTFSDPKVSAVAAIAAGNWPGGASGDPALIRPADQSKYPGFYITADGGYVNPDTGDYYSPGSSPVSYSVPDPTFAVDGLNLETIYAPPPPVTAENPPGYVIY